MFWIVSDRSNAEMENEKKQIRMTARLLNTVNRRYKIPGIRFAKGPFNIDQEGMM